LLVWTAQPLVTCQQPTEPPIPAVRAWRGHRSPTWSCAASDPRPSLSSPANTLLSRHPARPVLQGEFANRKKISLMHSMFLIIPQVPGLATQLRISLNNFFPKPQKLRRTMLTFGSQTPPGTLGAFPTTGRSSCRASHDLPACAPSALLRSRPPMPTSPQSQARPHVHLVHPLVAAICLSAM